MMCTVFWDAEGILLIDYTPHKPGFILVRVIRVKNENGRKFTRKK